MSASKLPVGSFVRIEKNELEAIIAALRDLGYRVIGPVLGESAIIYAEIQSVDDFPRGYIDDQDGGRYRLEQRGDAWFDYVVGPHSLKQYLFPPQASLLESQRVDNSWQMTLPRPPEKPLAFIGPRACDLRAVEIQDRVFLGEQFHDPGYAQRREGIFTLAVNCRRAAATCFCHSMKTGPAVRGDFDLALTEMVDSFVLEVGSDRGGQVADAADWRPCTTDEIAAARGVSEDLLQEMRLRAREVDDPSQELKERYLDTTDIRDLLLENLEHQRWDEVAQRCLACGNCTMVCPTCFCSSVREVTDLTGSKVVRQRSWDSCFTDEHSYMSGISVRQSGRSRYRQWLTHKLASWIDQFGLSGCVGCGRCITWCPVGIDLTEEVAAIRGGSL